MHASMQTDIFWYKTKHHELNRLLDPLHTLITSFDDSIDRRVFHALSSVPLAASDALIVSIEI